MATTLRSFDVNQTGFPSDQSRGIWFLGKEIIPLAISLADISDAEMRKGCMQIRRATMEMLSDLYATPEQYSPHHLGILLARLIKCGAVIGESGYIWSMPSDVFRKQVGRLRDSELMLQKLGFKPSVVGAQTVLSNKKHPLLLKSWPPFLAACQKRGVNTLSCDFRVFGAKFKLTLEDFLRTHADRDRAYFKELHEYAVSKGAKLNTHFEYRRFRYIYRSECVLIFEDSEMKPCVVVPYNNQYSRKRNSWTSFDLFMAAVDAQPDRDELVRYIQKQISVCQTCSDRGCGHWLDIHGVRRMAAACHPEISKCLESDGSRSALADDIRMLKRMMDMRVVQTERFGR